MEIKGNIIGYAIGLYILAAIIPGAITNLMTANTTGWTDTVKTIWDLLPIIVIAGFIVTRD